jgi:hypothetical protein
MPQFCTKKTSSEMNDEAKKATAEGMRQIAAALSTKNFEEHTDEEEDLTPKRSSARIANARVEKLETRIHYLQLDLANVTVDLDDTKNALVLYQGRYEVYLNIDKQFAILHQMNSYLNNKWQLTLAQLEKKHSDFLDKSAFQLDICEDSIEKIDLPIVKSMMQISLNEMRKQIINIESSIYFTIMMYKIYNVLIGSGIIVIIATIIASTIIEYNNAKMRYYF